MSEELHIEVDELFNKINEKITSYRSIFHYEPKVIVVPDYVEYFMRTYLKINTSVAFNYNEYSTFMGILVVGTKTKKEIKDIEVF